MTRRAAPTPSPTDEDATRLVGRRGLLRGAAVLAGAAGAVTVGALGPDAAQAADGDAIRAGQDNSAASGTSLTIGGNAGADAAALALNNANGPSLSLQALPADWAGQLAVGDMAGSDLGPVVGVDTVNGPTTTYLATGVDLANIPTPFASTPSRVLDLRTAAGRSAVVRRSSSDALASDGKLRAGKWIDIAVAPTGPDYVLEAVFGNLTVTRPVSWGWAALFPPGVQPSTSSLNFSTGATVANAAFVGVGSVLGYHAVRLYTTRDAWFLLDVTGGVTSGTQQAPLPQIATVRAAGGRQAVIRRLRQSLSRMSR